MMEPIYQHPGDNIAGSAVITVASGSEDSAYPVAYLTDGRITRPMKFTSQTGTLLFTFAGAQRVDLFALGPHNLDAALAVTLKGNTVDSGWGSPAFSVAVTIPATDEDDLKPCPFVDLTQAAGYSATGWQYWRLEIAGTNSVPIQLGEVWMSQLKRTFTNPYRWDFEIDEDRLIEEHETEYGTLVIYDLQIRRRKFKATFPANDTVVDEIRRWHRAMRGRVNKTVFIPNDSTNEAWWIVLPKNWLQSSIAPDFSDIALDIEELSKGLPL